MALPVHGASMGFQIPAALAGDNNEVELNEEGARTVIRLIGGTALGAGILAAGAYAYRRAASVAGAEQNVGDLY